MTLRRLLAALLLALAAQPCSAAPPPPLPPPALSSADEAAIGLAVDRGALIYAYDQAAWHGSDDAKAKLHDAGIVGGWIVDGPARAPELIVYDKDAADPHAVYVADFRDGKLVSSRVIGAADDRELSASRKALVAARRTASAALTSNAVTRCSAQPFNTVVLPPQVPGAPILVYFLTPQTKTDMVPLGGHYRIEVGADGKAGPVHPFTHSCIDMPVRGGKMVGGFITHLLDPVPTEIHVFSSLAAKLPLFVATTQNHRLWSIEGSRISLVSNDVGK